MPITPDYSALALQQSQLTNNAASSTTQANRANQYNPYGSLTWGQAPDGTWTQSVNLNPQYQQLNDTVNAGITNLAGNVGAGFNATGLPDFGSTDITNGVSAMPDGGFGASQQVIDAMRGLQQPTLDSARDAERTRMAAMGLTLGSDASNTSEYNLGRTQNDADLKAILAGTQEYGNVFNRQLAQRQQGVDENIKRSNLMNALRQQHYGEQLGEYQADIAGMGALGSQRVKPEFSSYAGATPTVAPNMYGAAQDTFNANLANENASRASSAARTAGNVGLAGAGISALGGLGGVTQGLGGLLGSAGSALGNWWGNVTGSPGSDTWFGGLYNNGDSTDYLGGVGDASSDVLGDFGSNLGWW